MRARWAATAMVVAACSMGVAGTARAETPNGYAITVDGSSYEAPAVPILGAIEIDRSAVFVHDADVLPTCLIVGPPGHYTFTYQGDDGSRGYLAGPGQTRRLAWIKIWNNEVRGRTTLVNPLRTLSRAQVRGLRGILVEDWSPQVAADIARLDLTRLCISARTLPTDSPFPTGIRYLALDNFGKGSVSDLRSLPQLVFLSVDTGEQPFDAAWIATATNLQYLGLRVGALDNGGRLEGLRSMRNLTLRAHQGIERVDFLRGMTELEDLSLNGSVDLTPIGGLAHLVRLNAGASKASHLPAARMPALRDANLMSTDVLDADVERFRALNPEAVVLHRWTPQLRAGLAGATEVELEVMRRVRSDPQLPSVVVRDPSEVAKLIATLEIDDPHYFVMGCMETHRLTFRRVGGPAKGTVIYLADGNSVRWEGFPGDAPLTAAALPRTRAWLARHGIDWSDCGGGRKPRSGAPVPTH